MTRKTILLISVVIIIAALSVFWLSREPVPKSAESSLEKIQVATTIFPLKSIAEEIGGDRIEVELILPPGASPHTYEPTMSSVTNLQGVELVFAIGQGLDGWVVDLIPDSAVVKEVSQGIDLIRISAEGELGHEEEGQDSADHSHGDYNPHYWLSATGGQQIANNIVAGLIDIDPAGRETYEQNLDIFLKDLLAADQRIKEQLSDLEKEEMVTFHDAWPYFAREYGLEIAATFEPVPGKEPTPQYLEKLQAEVEQNDVEVIFSEPQLSTQALQPFLDDMDVVVAVLDPLGGEGDDLSFVSLLEKNARVIEQSL